MIVKYDAKTDTLTLILRDAPVADSDEGKPGLILDYDVFRRSCLHRDTRCFKAGGGAALR